MIEQQLFLFQETREDILEKKINLLEDQTSRVRKNLFAKYTELMQLYLEQKTEIDTLKSLISSTQTC
jgi:hypothetical protein